MITSTKNHPTLAEVFWPQNAIARSVLLAVVGSLLMWVSAKVQVPFYPVPMTMQTFVALGIGAAYGWRLGGATIMLYLIEGAAGLPVFAGTPEKGIGLAYMMGPTGGYLVGFVIAAMIVGWLAERGFDRNPVSTFGIMLLGTIAIFVPGLIWLSALIGVGKAIQFGLMPFIWAGLFKTALAAAVFPALWAFAKKLK